MDILRKLGDFDPCNPKEILEDIKEISKDYKEEVEDAINSLAALSFGPFLVTLKALVSQMIQGAVVNFKAFVASALIGNLVGGVTTLVGLAVSLVTGVQVMLKYLSASRLSEALTSRIDLAQSLGTDMSEVIKVLQALRDMDEDTGEILLHNIDSAYPHVQNASQRVGIEYSKVEGLGNLQTPEDDSPINSRSLRRAREHIDKAMQFLIGDQTINPAFRKALKNINDKYQIGGSFEFGGEEIGASMASPIAVLQYFKDASDALIENNSDDRGQVTEKGRQMLRNFLVDFVQAPGINQYFRNYASMRFLGSHLQSLGQHLPITAVVLKDFATDQTSSLLNKGGLRNPLENIQLEVQGALDGVFDYLKLNETKNTVEYESEDVTLGGTSIEVKASHSAVLLMEQWIDIVNYEVGGLKLFLKPANDRLTDVRRDMHKVLDNKDSYNTNAKKRELLRDKMEWMAQLGEAKAFISSSIEAPVNFAGGGSATPEKINNQFRDSLELYSKLQTTILNRTVERSEVAEVEIEEIPQESDQILEKADKYLKSFVLGELAVFNSDKRKTLLAQLQSMKSLTNRMIEKDRKELTQARNFIRSVESNPLFASVIKPSWEGAMENLKDSPVGEFLYEDLANGDLSSLVNSLTNVGYGAQKLLNIFNCSESSDNSNFDIIDRILSGGDQDKLDKVKRISNKAEETMDQLQNKGDLIQTITTEAQSQIDRVA